MQPSIILSYETACSLVDYTMQAWTSTSQQQTPQIELTAVSSFPANPLRCMEGTVLTAPAFHLCMCIDGSQFYVCTAPLQC